MKIALIGYGNIANAIINGMLSSEKTKVIDDIYVFHNHYSKSIRMKKFISLGEDNRHGLS